MRVFALICIFCVLNASAIPKFHKPTARKAPKTTAATHPPPPPPTQAAQVHPVQNNPAPVQNNAAPPSYQQQPQPVYHPQQFNQPQAPAPQPVVVHHVIEQPAAPAKSSGGLGVAGGLAVGALAGL